jgi:acyl-CoA hydrolase/RimJ/RimL family protein N-acetyltransferase
MVSSAVGPISSTQVAAPAWKALYESKKDTAERALRALRRGDRVFIGSGCGEPQHLVRGLEDAMEYLADLEILHILSLGKSRYTEAGFHEKCRLKSFFIAGATREAVAEGRADYTPVNLVDIPELFRSGVMPITVALIQVSAPDQHGYCSYGVAVDIVKAAAETAGHVIAQVNPMMPRTLGDSFIHVRDLDTIVEWEEPLLEMEQPPLNAIAEAIGRHVAKLVEDGSTIRAGVGSLPNAALYALEDKRDLGVHTDMLTDAYLHLVHQGVITNARKTLHPGKIVTSFCLGTRKLFDFVHNNPMVAFFPSEYTNDYLVISQNDKMVTINSALEVDLTGQVCADSLGYVIYSGVGGAVDFVRGARNSRGGKTIVVMPSTTLDGERSRIVPALTEGAGVVTTRGGVQYVVTEYGVAQLHGKSLRERALALISIAHPNFRDELMKEGQRLNYLPSHGMRVGTARAIYPHEWEVTQVFDDGLRVLFRPVKPTDERPLLEFFYTLPREESYVRFISTMKVYPRYDTQRMANIDYQREMSIVVLVGELDAERIIAFGTYFIDEETRSAEVDFAVHPDYGRKGIASFLIQQLMEIAKTKLVHRFVAFVSPGSVGSVTGVFQKMGCMVESTLEEELYEISLDFGQPALVCQLD